MSPRQQRLAEAVKRRDALNAQIDAMTRSGMPGTWNDDTTSVHWRYVAQSNQRLLEELLEGFRLRHIRHDLAMKGVTR